MSLHLKRVKRDNKYDGFVLHLIIIYYIITQDFFLKIIFFELSKVLIKMESFFDNLIDRIDRMQSTIQAYQQDLSCEHGKSKFTCEECLKRIKDRIEKIKSLKDRSQIST